MTPYAGGFTEFVAARSTSLLRGVGTSKWLDSVPGAVSKPTIISGLHGTLRNQGAGQTFTWTPEFGLAVMVTAPKRDLRQIVKGIEVP
ncbi:hypothetical protein [Nonomuraea endophytica]|uniref:hypothetical protein n=1 Tax=Nonomuraea endophytica TaxID=714136 RepID=UPI0037C92273